MKIWLTLLCLSPKAPTSMLNDCQALIASPSEKEAKEGCADICGDDGECRGRCAIQALPLQLGLRSWLVGAGKAPCVVDQVGEP